MTTEDTNATTAIDLTVVPGAVTAFKSTDGLLFATPEARDAHDRALKYGRPVRDFVAYAGYRGRSKTDRAQAITDFLLWNDAGRPVREVPVVEAAPAAPVEAAAEQQS